MINFTLSFTVRELLDACLDCKTKEQAEKLLASYKEVNPKYAEINLGYIFGYLDEVDRKRMYSLFPVKHPIFGENFGRTE